jgi:hypothetical protein
VNCTGGRFGFKLDNQPLDLTPPAEIQEISLIPRRSRAESSRSQGVCTMIFNQRQGIRHHFPVGKDRGKAVIGLCRWHEASFAGGRTLYS